MPEPRVDSLTDPVDLLTYRRDCSAVKPGQPARVVRPRDRDELVAAVRDAHAADAAVYVRGGGTMYAGGANPHAGGTVIDISAMTRVLELDLARGVVVVEPGIRFGALLEALRPHGQTVGIVPVTGPSATVGGAVSSHALGTGSPRHQSIGDCVAGLEVVLADGAAVSTGSAAIAGAGYFQRYCIGPDLTGLFVGGDASFGIIAAVALWLYPLPATRDTVSLGFADAHRAGAFLAAVQGRELTRNAWYAAGYEGGTVRARVSAAVPDHPLEALPGFCIGFELGADAGDVARDRDRLVTLAAEYGGARCDVFDQTYFRRLRFEQSHWYSFAGYFSLSRCALLMTSLPCDRLPAFIDVINDMRARYDAFTWGAAVVVCRRGLHGGVVTFYDEAREWDAVLQAMDVATADLVSAGCVPYKSGKLWAPRLHEQPAYLAALAAIKQGLDPRGQLAPGNLGLDPAGRLGRSSGAQP